MKNDPDGINVYTKGVFILFSIWSQDGSTPSYVPDPEFLDAYAPLANESLDDLTRLLFVPVVANDEETPQDERHTIDISQVQWHFVKGWLDMHLKLYRDQPAVYVQMVMRADMGLPVLTKQQEQWVRNVLEITKEIGL